MFCLPCGQCVALKGTKEWMQVWPLLDLILLNPPPPSTHSNMPRYTSFHSRASTLSPAVDDQEGQKRQFDIDINTDDGYTLSAFGDISISDGFFILTSTSLVDVDVGSSRRRIRARRPPMPHKFSSRSSASDYEDAAREYPRFPFPDLPTPTSPYSAEADFEALFQSLKSHQASYKAPSHNLTTESSAHKPILRVETSGLSDRRIPFRGFSRASYSRASSSLGALPRQSPGMAFSVSPIHVPGGLPERVSIITWR